MIDPLSSEARMDRMREEMDRLRRIVLSFVPDRYRRIVNPPLDFTREEGLGWAHDTAEKIIELMAPDAGVRAPCPLCGDVSSPPYDDEQGFTFPVGLERHLLGTHNTTMCGVMYAVTGILRVRFRELHPGHYGPYGCD